MDLFETCTFAASREAALERLREFVPRAGRYARDRNKVVPGHYNVSRLSPAVRHRLLTEDECCHAPLERYAHSTVEKFIQEVSWRRYWKAWLSLRPQVWSQFLGDLQKLRATLSDPALGERVRRCETGESKVGIMNHFARELVETGYLHNHARMWFAGWWIHVERLPWQLGADFFFRHLLDGDPASNTLSWRWVAGLQTPGKTYLPRRSNIEKHVDPEILTAHKEGLDLLEHPSPWRPRLVARDQVTEASRKPADPADATPLGIWIHEEDLLPEYGPLQKLQPSALLVTGDVGTWESFRFSSRRRAWLEDALSDARARAQDHFGQPVEHELDDPIQKRLPAWARQHRLRQVAALRPEVGPLADQLPLLRDLLAAEGTELVLLDRPEDLALRPLATGGFFNFWRKCQRVCSPTNPPSTVQS